MIDIPDWILVVLFVLTIITAFWYNINKSKKHLDKESNAKCIINNKKYKKYTILDFLKQASKDNPKKTALKIKTKNSWKSVSYLEYYDNVLNFAQSINYWLGPKVNVSILGFNSPGWFFAHMGCMLNGGISVGLYPTSTSKICEKIINDANVELLVVEDDEQLKKFMDIDISGIKLIIYYSPISKKMVDKFSVPVISMGNFMTKRVTTTLKPPHLDDIATLIYTSGTTGNQKGTMITHKNIMSSVSQMLSLIDTKSGKNSICGERFISYLPLNHIAAQMMDIYIPLVTLSTVWFADKNALKSTLGDTIKDAKPTIFIGVPRVWEKIVEQIEAGLENEGVGGSLVKLVSPWKIIEKIGFNKCKLAITSTAPISENTIKYLEAIGLPLYNTYGMSETTGPISVSVPNASAVGSVGVPIMKVKIAKDNEILVKGDNLFVGYYKNKKATTESFTKDGWFKTGDLGKLDKGFLYVTGRKKEIIITAGGENISPIPIENELHKYLSNYFEYIIVIGDKMKFLSVILNSTKKLPKNINEIVNNAITETNKKAQSNTHTIKKFLIIPKKFSVGNELTPTFKTKREFIQTKYAKQIQELYKQSSTK